MIYLVGAIALIILTQETIKDVMNSEVRNYNRFDSLFKKYASQYNLDWKMLKAICMIESTMGYNPRVARGLIDPQDVNGSKSTDGLSWGIMQVTVTTAKDYDPTATPQKLNNPEYSVKIASQHLAMLYKFFNFVSNRKTEFIVKSYNQGQGNTLKEIQGKTQGYANEYWSKYVNAYKDLS